MDSKHLIWIGMFVGSAIGSYVPVLWGDSVFSISSIVWSTIGGVAGIWLGFRASHL